MSGSLNMMQVIGHLGADPEVRFTPSGRAVANFRVATTESWQDSTGKDREETEWHRVVAWGKLAEICGEHLKKGRQVYVQGRLKTSPYEKDGQTHYSTEVIAQTVTFLGPPPKAAANQAA